MKKIIIALILLSLTTPAFAGKVRVVYKPDGSISVIHPSPNSQERGETESQWLNRVFNKTQKNDSKLAGLPFDDIEESVLPDRNYRDAWRGSKGSGVAINEQKRGEIEQERLIKAKILDGKRKDAVVDLKAEGKLPSDFQP